MNLTMHRPLSLPLYGPAVRDPVTVDHRPRAQHYPLWFLLRKVLWGSVAVVLLGLIALLGLVTPNSACGGDEED